MNPASGAPRRPARGLRVLAVAAAAATYLLIVAGGVVRVTGSGLGCGATGQDWPLCHGRLVPPADVATVIEFSHRSLATIASVLIGLLALTAVRRYRHIRRIVVPAVLVVAQLIVQILLGALTVELELPGGIVLVHLANALLLLGVLVLVVTAAFTLPDSATSTAPAPPATPARWGLVLAATAFVVVLSGGLVVANGAGFACAGWPLCGDGLHAAAGQLATINLLHRGIVGAGTAIIALCVWRMMRALGDVPAVRVAATVVGRLLFVQIVLGAVLVEVHLPALVRGLHEAFASAVWAAAVLLAVLVQPGTLSRIGRGARPARRTRVPAGVGVAGRAPVETVPS